MTNTAPPCLCLQAGLPLDKFYAVVKEPPCDDRPNIHIEIPDQRELMWLQKMFTDSESVFISTMHDWHQHVQTMLDNSSDAKACHVGLMSMMKQRQVAIDTVGYLSEVEVNDWPGDTGLTAVH